MVVYIPQIRRDFTFPRFLKLLSEPPRLKNPVDLYPGDLYRLTREEIPLLYCSSVSVYLINCYLIRLGYRMWNKKIGFVLFDQHLIPCDSGRIVECQYQAFTARISIHEVLSQRIVPPFHYQYGLILNLSSPRLCPLILKPTEPRFYGETIEYI